MGLSDAFLQEIEHEGKTTRRVLERVPGDRLGWRPHARSMSLGELALHVAKVPGVISSWCLEDISNLGGSPPQAQAQSTDEVLKAHDASMAKAKEVLGTLGDSGLQRNWQAQAGGATLMTMPKVALFRSIVLNHWYHHRGQLSVIPVIEDNRPEERHFHWYHHRGQLSVYLRLLDVPVPSIYGPSADENPMART